MLQTVSLASPRKEARNFATICAQTLGRDWETTTEICTCPPQPGSWVAFQPLMHSGLSKWHDCSLPHSSQQGSGRVSHPSLTACATWLCRKCNSGVHQCSISGECLSCPLSLQLMPPDYQMNLPPSVGTFQMAFVFVFSWASERARLHMSLPREFQFPIALWGPQTQPHWFSKTDALVGSLFQCRSQWLGYPVWGTNPSFL